MDNNNVMMNGLRLIFSILISLGATSAFSLTPNHSVKCWGSNLFGNLGLEDEITRGDKSSSMGNNLPTLALLSEADDEQLSIKKIRLGVYHSCAIFSNNRIKCWGSNGMGALGVGDTGHHGSGKNQMGGNLPFINLGTDKNHKPLKVLDVSLGVFNTCALLSNHRMKCWGANETGQLGLGHTESLGRAPGDMGNNLPYVDLGTDFTGSPLKVKQVSNGQYYSNCALLQNGGIKCWGYNELGDLGLGDTEDRGQTPESMGDNLPYVKLGTSSSGKGAIKAIKMVGGEAFNCALLENHRVKCWGVNNSGRLGIGDARSRGGMQGDMGDNLPYVDLGADESGAAITVEDVTAGQQHVCSLLSNHQIKCWGDNYLGQLGLGDSNVRGEASHQMGNALPYVSLGVKEHNKPMKVTALSSGFYHNCATLENSQIKCWGHNYSGRLGLEDTKSRGKSEDDMGDNLPFVNIGVDGQKAPLEVLQLHSGGAHNCVVFKSKLPN